MEHAHSVIDSDNRFIINPITKAITNESEKNKLIQYDHNSERFTFEIPRFVDGHDMSLCSKVEIHYINISEKGDEQSKDVYPVTDLAVDEWDSEKVVFSWLVSGNATKYAGSLNFLVGFTCLTGEEIDYAWHTEIYRGITVAEGMNNGEAVVAEFSDVLEALKAELEERYANGGGGGVGETVIDQKITEAKTDLIGTADDEAGADTIKGAKQLALDLMHILENKVVKTEQLNEAVESALTEAKASGEFDGANGLSAYEIWLQQGNTGSEEDFLNSLQGDTYTLTEADKAEIVAQLSQIEAPKIVSSINEMTDTTKHYGLDGNIWAYMLHETVIPESNFNVFNYDTSDGARINTRMSQGGTESTTSGAKGSFITNYIATPNWDETESPYNMYINFPIQSVSLSATTIVYYDSNKTFISSNVVNANNYSINNETTTIDLKTFGTSSSYTEIPDGVAYVRVQLFKNESGTELTTADLSGVEIMLEANKTPSSTEQEYGWADTGISYAPTFKTDLIGVLGEGNVVYLSDNLPSGTYTLKYGDENYDTIGTITVE